MSGLLWSREYLPQWRHDYPGKPEGDNLGFLNKRKKPITNAEVIVQLRKICERAGITIHVTPHLFRHSKITHLINEGVSDSVIKMMMWGSVHTDMFKTYAHLTGKDIDYELKRLYGITIEKKKRKPQDMSEMSKYHATCSRILCSVWRIIAGKTSSSC